MLFCEAAIGAAFLKYSVQLPWAHHSLPFPARSPCFLFLISPLPLALTLFLPPCLIPPVQTTYLSFSLPDLCTCRPSPRRPLPHCCRHPSRTVLIPGHFSMDPPGCIHEMGWQNYPPFDIFLWIRSFDCVTPISWVLVHLPLLD